MILWLSCSFYLQKSLNFIIPLLIQNRKSSMCKNCRNDLAYIALSSIAVRYSWIDMSNCHYILQRTELPLQWIPEFVALWLPHCIINKSDLRISLIETTPKVDRVEQNSWPRSNFFLLKLWLIAWWQAFHACIELYNQLKSLRKVQIFEYLWHRVVTWHFPVQSVFIKKFPSIFLSENVLIVNTKPCYVAIYFEIAHLFEVKIIFRP